MHHSDDATNFMNSNLSPSHAALLGMHQGMRGQGHPHYGMQGLHAPHPGMVPPHLGRSHPSMQGLQAHPGMIPSHIGRTHPGNAGMPPPLQHHQGLSSQAKQNVSLKQFPTSMASKVSSSVNDMSSSQNPMYPPRVAQNGSNHMKPPGMLPYSSEPTSSADISVLPRTNVSSNPANPFLHPASLPGKDSVTTSSRHPEIANHQSVNSKILDSPDRPQFNGRPHQDHSRSPISNSKVHDSPDKLSFSGMPHQEHREKRSRSPDLSANVMNQSRGAFNLLKENSSINPFRENPVGHQSMKAPISSGLPPLQVHPNHLTSATAGMSAEDKQLYAWKMQQYIDSLGDSEDDGECESEPEEEFNQDPSGAVNRLLANRNISIEPQNRAHQKDQIDSSSSLTKKLMMNNSISIAPQGKSVSLHNPNSTESIVNASNGQLSIYEQLRARGVSVEMTQIPMGTDEYSDED